MKLTDHCSLCENQLIDFNIGTSCALTQKKPDFVKYCPSFQIGPKFWKELHVVNIKHQLLLDAERITYLHAAVFASFGIAVVCGGYYFGSVIWDAGFISTVPLSIVAVGLALTSYSLAPIRTFRNKLAISSKNKSRMDDVLQLYGIEYDISLTVDKEIHGSHDIHMELNIKGTDKSAPNAKKVIIEDLRYDTDDIMHASHF